MQQKMIIGSAGPALSSAVAPAAALPCRCALDASSTAHCSPQQAHEHGQVELGGLALVDLVDLDGRRRPAAFSSTLNGLRGHVAFGSDAIPFGSGPRFAQLGLAHARLMILLYRPQTSTRLIVDR